MPAAQRLGQLRHDQLAADFIPEWRGGPAEGVTVDMLLRHDSGRYTARAFKGLFRPNEAWRPMCQSCSTAVPPRSCTALVTRRQPSTCSSR